MVIQCENCKRSYRLDDSRIRPPGSSVRCSKCGHIFFVSKAEDPDDKSKLVTSQETPLTEVTEDFKKEIASEEKITESLEIEEDVPETSSDLTQGKLTINEDNKDELFDLPTEHEENLEDFIDENIEEEATTEIQSEEVLTIEEELDNQTEISDIQETDESIENPPELFEEENDYNNDKNLDIEEIDRDKSFEDENYTDLSPLPENDIESSPLEQETHTIDNNDQEDFDYRDEEISHEPSAGKITKSNTGIVTKFIYTLITIAAIFTIFMVSLIILINAEILPKGTLSGLTTIVEAVIPLKLNEKETPNIIISENQGRWMNTVNGPVYIVSGQITNESQSPVHYVKLRSEYIAADKKQYEDTFYAGNTFTDIELKVSPIQKILSKLDQKNGDIDVNNSRKLAGLNYNIQPGESIPFFTVFPADGIVLGLRYNLEVIDYKKASSN
ncbi:MAG: hypothetical protein DHS20C13_09590 [Thermodesulfobacteriota bacterium]|nr:MAG: hypothetical protein DHS20C13_09590 [Thermodesulfobacteriota bacterium]